VGTRIAQVAATAICLLVCAACGSGIGNLASRPSPSAPAVATSTDATISPSAGAESGAPYVESAEDVRGLATRFVTLVLSYQAHTEEARTFLGRLEGLATAGELDRLRRSERAHLRWWVLRQRGESAAIRVTGVSQQAESVSPIRLHVEAVRVTSSSVGTVRDFLDLTLDVVRTPEGWRVDRAEGGGL
jgi:hypothetical protein